MSTWLPHESRGCQQVRSFCDCVAKLEGVWRRDWSVSFLPFRHPDLVLRWLLDERIGIDD
jgi:hypothetical protein